MHFVKFQDMNDSLLLQQGKIVNLELHRMSGFRGRRCTAYMPRLDNSTGPSHPRL